MELNYAVLIIAQRIFETKYWQDKTLPWQPPDSFEYLKQIRLLLGMLLGDGSVGSPERPTIYMVGHLVDERGFYDYLVIPLIVELFPVRPYSYVRNGKNAYAVHFKSRRLIEYLVSEIGSPSSQGLKFLPKVVHSLPDSGKCSFIRGLFDSDGTLVFSKRPMSLINIQQ